ncbi:unnamed protein product [Protopolystoma xenopodis]|uniref:Uncharacterized protein n=1 Tax=Protopolystoma xenopodis TaxID=117903 RepID=A0A3S5BZ53_9PLAT|nr:unnamed protein product [Protopolystoma xenopodis]
MDTKISELVEHIAQTEHEINWKSTERIAPFGDNTKNRKIMEAIDILGETNLMKRRFEEGRVSDNFAYCLSKLRENKNGARPTERRRLDQGSIADWRKRDCDDESVGQGYSAIKRRCFQCVMPILNKPVQLWGPGSQGAGQTDKQTVTEIRRYAQNALEIHFRCRMRPEIGAHSLLR